MSAVLPAATAAAPAPLRHPQWVLWALCAIALMNTAGVAMPYPILAPIFVDGAPDAFTHWMGLPPKLLMGLALAANPLGILLGSLVLGPLSDRYGRRRLLLLCLVATLLWQLLSAGALELRSYPLFVLARFVTGLTEGSVAITRALLADHHPQLDRTRSFAWLNACLYGGWLLGPLLGGQALRFGEPMPFALAALALLPCIAVLAVALPGDRAATSAAGAGAGFWRAVREQQTLGLLARDALLRRLFWLQLAYTIGVHALYEFAPLWLLENLGLDGAGIAWVTAAQCGTMVLASIAATRLPQARRPLRRAALMALLAALGLLLLAVVPGRWGMALIVALGAPLAIYGAVLPSWMSERFAAHGQGRVMGLLSTVFCLANVLVALAGSLLALLDTRWVMALGGLAACTAAARLLRLAREDAEQEGPA